MSELFAEIYKNPASIDIREIPVIKYDDFYEHVSGLLKDQGSHCVTYFADKIPEGLKFYCIIGDNSSALRVYSFVLENAARPIRSLTPSFPRLHGFERELHENHGIIFEGHPWLKPVRYPYGGKAGPDKLSDYPFYGIDSDELHEVGVGPLHAGIIEPGYFRFICNGEKVLHLEIQLGYQNRGVENLMISGKSILQRCILSENIAGDTAVGHSLAHSQLVDSLIGAEPSESLMIERCIALELERIAIHIGDTAALCGDVAYQLGQVVCEALRTTVINTTQNWCGNRFGKGLVRPGGTNYPANDSFIDSLLVLLDDTGSKFYEIADRIITLPSVLARFEDIGRITTSQTCDAGAVGMAARSAGIARDIRISYPYQYYKTLPVNIQLLEGGDVLSRCLLRILEVKESDRYIRELAGFWRRSEKNSNRPEYHRRLEADRLTLSLVEGWRGEICHTAVTNGEGELTCYKIKDPSFHNWMALALAVRNQEISDFPVCNKSFNLSYCGHDL
ncbi:MAG: NADH dehydrogenase subunit [Bacteroidales bacterium]|nr:NADH dehydrogenase subunit [Bacteroidales bacterium]